MGHISDMKAFSAIYWIFGQQKVTEGNRCWCKDRLSIYCAHKDFIYFLSPGKVPITGLLTGPSG